VKAFSNLSSDARLQTTAPDSAARPFSNTPVICTQVIGVITLVFTYIINIILSSILPVTVTLLNYAETLGRAGDGVDEAGRLNLEPLFGRAGIAGQVENAFTLLQGGLAGKICCTRMECRARRIAFQAFELFCSKPRADAQWFFPGRVQVRSAGMSDTATITSKMNPLQYVADDLKELRAKGVAPRLRVLEGEAEACLHF